ncbi:MAG: response regulator [Armatimonadetes bacterium]|nr:response regulator [Armatimonadota bacterium]
MKILIAEDDFASALVLEKALVKEGHDVTVARDGQVAIEKFKDAHFDALLTDWMMPEVDGVELIRWVRKNVSPVPLVMMLTVITNPEARAHALEAGADEFIEKPYKLATVIELVETGYARHQQCRPPIPEQPPAPQPPETERPFVAVLLAAGTGGPRGIEEFFREVPAGCRNQAAFFVVLHGPDWLVYDVMTRLEQSTHFPVHLSEDGMVPKPGNIYLAHGEKHLVIDPTSLELRLTNDPPENFVRPSADVLFRSASAAFGKHCVAVVMSGIGCDGAAGAARVKNSGGLVLAQAPDTAMAPAMPQAVIEAGLEDRVLDIPALAESVAWCIEHVTRPTVPGAVAPAALAAPDAGEGAEPQETTLEAAAPTEQTVSEPGQQAETAQAIPEPEQQEARTETAPEPQHPAGTAPPIPEAPAGAEPASEPASIESKRPRPKVKPPSWASDR